MSFIQFNSESGIVTGYQEIPDDVCYLAESELIRVADISEGQLQRVKEARESGVILEYKSGRLYEVGA